jgi:hypothetical protein
MNARTPRAATMLGLALATLWTAPAEAREPYVYRVVSDDAQATFTVPVAGTTNCFDMVELTLRRVKEISWERGQKATSILLDPEFTYNITRNGPCGDLLVGAFPRTDLEFVRFGVTAQPSSASEPRDLAASTKGAAVRVRDVVASDFGHVFVADFDLTWSGKGYEKVRTPECQVLPDEVSGTCLKVVGVTVSRQQALSGTIRGTHTIGFSSQPWSHDLAGVTSPIEDVIQVRAQDSSETIEQLGAPGACQCPPGRTTE